MGSIIRDWGEIMKTIFLIFIGVTFSFSQALIYVGSDGKMYKRTSTLETTGAGTDVEFTVSATVDSTIYLKVWKHGEKQDKIPNIADTVKYFEMKDSASLFYDRFYTCGTASFSTTLRRLAIFVSGTTTSSIFSISAISGTDVVPVAGDLLSYNRKTDSLIILRPASGTSGLTVSWTRIKK